jgi:hypothetical protein
MNKEEKYMQLLSSGHWNECLAAVVELNADHFPLYSVALGGGFWENIIQKTMLDFSYICRNK